MKKLLIATALAGLFAGSSALAQDRHDDHGHGGGPGNAPAAHPTPPAPPPHAPATDHGRGHQTPAIAGRADSHPGPNHGRPDNNNRPAMAGPSRAPTAMRGPGNNNAANHRDFSSYHRNFTAPRHFHAPSYRRPSGWYAHRWSFGEVLPALFWTHDYWLDDFNDYGLMPPPPGTVWVRYGDDALLIDRYTGEVIQVEYGVFY